MLMPRDIRSTPTFAEVEAHHRAVLGPGFGGPEAPQDPVPSPDGRSIAFTASFSEDLVGRPGHRIYVVAADGSDLRRVTVGPHDDRDPRWSPDGSRLTFLSDRRTKGHHQLHELRIGGVGEAVPHPEVPGVVESHAWSGDGRRILLGVAGTEAEEADALGSGTVARNEPADASWLPEVRSGEESPEERRRTYVLDVEAGQASPVGDERWNVWEATWLGTDRIAVLVSERAEEGAWYDAHARVIDLGTGTDRELLRSEVQLNLLTGSPDGATLAVVEARCSDRYVAAGDLLLVDAEDGRARRVDAAGADVTSVRWIDDHRLLVGAIRGLSSLVLEVDVGSGIAMQRWGSDGAAGRFYPYAAPLPDGGFVTVVHDSRRPPTLVTVGRDGVESQLAAIRHAGHEVVATAFDRTEPIAWRAADGLELQGLVHVPNGAGPFPLLVRVHGGPVSAYQDGWLDPLTSLLLGKGYAIFWPNPRGSGGRGRAFADMVVGDMGGADAGDVLTGIDHVVGMGVGDPDRIGVYGGSYGGFMATWLPAIDGRFRAAVAVSPVTDWVSQHFTSSLAAWDESFVGASPTDPVTFGRSSPVMRSDAVATPTLLTAGLKDRATPAGQAIEFWQALRLRGVPTELVLYPEEGHGVSTYPAIIDLDARIVDWFAHHLPAS